VGIGAIGAACGAISGDEAMGAAVIGEADDDISGDAAIGAAAIGAVAICGAELIAGALEDISAVAEAAGAAGAAGGAGAAGAAIAAVPIEAPAGRSGPCRLKYQFVWTCAGVIAFGWSRVSTANISQPRSPNSPET
jgi:hypothetical protein